MNREQQQYAAGAAPRCFRHPDRETWVSCTRCERPICPDCLRPAAVGFQCPDCVAAGAASTRAPRTRYGGAVVGRVGLVTGVIAALNVAAFVATAATSTGGFAHNEQSRLFDRTYLAPGSVAIDHEWWRLLSSAFMHIGPLHLLLNMMALAVVGPALERELGTWRYLGLYFLAALGGGVSVYLFDLHGAAGASGAIFGLFAATLVMARSMGLDARFFLLVVVINFAYSFRPGISLYGHLGGFVVGGLVAVALIYIPRGPNRTSLQLLSMGGTLAVLVALTIYRTSAIMHMLGL
jgi:membrane associated rhomboid family serine protease